MVSNPIRFGISRHRPSRLRSGCGVSTPNREDTIGPHAKVLTPQTQMFVSLLPIELMFSSIIAYQYAMTIKEELKQLEDGFNGSVWLRNHRIEPLLATPVANT